MHLTGQAKSAKEGSLDFAYLASLRENFLVFMTEFQE